VRTAAKVSTARASAAELRTNFLAHQLWVVLAGHRLYQRTVVLMSVLATLLVYGGLWVALVQTQLAVGAEDGSGSGDGVASDLALRRRYIVVATFLAVEILVRPRLLERTSDRPP
jgi:hypothetical protein